MLIDTQGLVVTTSSPTALAAINRFIDQSLCYGRDMETVILQGIAADPLCVIAHAYAAAYYLSQETTIDRQQAAPHLLAAQQHLAHTTPREQLYIKAIIAWSQQQILQAIALHETIATQFPQDLISVQQGQYHYFYQGNQPGLLAIAERVLPENRAKHYLYGMLAFGLEQCHRLREAEIAARRAIESNRHDPWAHHAIAHVLETQGRAAEGIAWMEQFADTWETCSSMLYTHNWWHIALYYLAQGDYQTVLHLYEKRVWGRARRSSPKDQVGAIALLLRLELRGVPVDNHWQEVALHLLPRLHEHALPFQDLHYIYALARAERHEWLRDMLQSLQARARTENSNSQVWQEIVIPAATGLIAHAQRDFASTITALQPVLPRLVCLGGSHAQRELFQQIYEDALRQTWQSHTALFANSPSWRYSA
jgi:tetratricopeptide (TPR) repeat protein